MMNNPHKSPKVGLWGLLIDGCPGDACALDPEGLFSAEAMHLGTTGTWWDQCIMARWHAYLENGYQAVDSAENELCHSSQKGKDRGNLTRILRVETATDAATLRR